MIASDGFIEQGRGHPRTSGTYAKVLGRYVREAQARHADGRTAADDARAGAPPRAARAVDGGEGPREGRRRCRPDDLRSRRPSIDRATYEDASIPSAGIPFVIVQGQVVVDGGVVTASRPGRAIRAAITKE